LRGHRQRPPAKGTNPDGWQRGAIIGSLVSVLLVAVGLYLTNDFNRDQFRLQQGSARQQQDLALRQQNLALQQQDLGLKVNKLTGSSELPINSARRRPAG
jgi:hypothetical protein